MMRMRLIAAGLGLLLAYGAGAAEEVTARALKLYEKHQYDEAARALLPEMQGIEASRLPSASLALGMIYLGGAELYRELYKAALVIEADYLKQLSRQKTAHPSRHVELYMGQVLSESGRYSEGLEHLRKFVTLKGVAETEKAFGSIETGLVFARQKQMQQAQAEWNGRNVKQADIRAAMAGVYALAGLPGQQPEQMADDALQSARMPQQKMKIRMLRNVLRAYANSGATEKALGLLENGELGEAAYIEELEASKTIYFYDTSLLLDMSRVYLNAAISLLEKAARDEKTGASAAYYLATAYLQDRNADLALLYLNRLMQSSLPPAIRNAVQVKLASVQYLKGKHDDAMASWLAQAEAAKEDPLQLAGVMAACTQIANECSKLEKLALAAAERGEGKKYFVLNAALGRYYQKQKDYLRALQYMEAGRDKANKNKIDANDPLLLNNLAEAYYRNKKFSESLEIYFELYKHFPAVRQIQDAMQGIYAMEQQSAGDVKMY